MRPRPRRGPPELRVPLRTRVGRLRRSLLRRSWPLARRAAAAYRRTVVARTRVVVVVGSLGKTTTARATARALGLRPRGLAANALGYVARAVLRIRPGQRLAVIEVGVNKPGQMGLYARLVRPDIVVVTSIASEHSRSFGSLEAIREEKATMVRALPEHGLAVLNGDDEHVLWMATQTRARVVTFGFGAGNDVRCTEREPDWPDGSTLTIESAGERYTVRSRLHGRPAAHAALAAIAVALAADVPRGEAVARIETLTPGSQRLQVVALPDGGHLVRDEFKSPSESMEVALDFIAEIPARRRVVVVGDIADPLGTPAQVYGPLGERIAAVADLAILVGRSARRYATGARRAGMPPEALVLVGPSVHAAIALLEGRIGPGDVVLVKGRDTQRLDRIALALMGRRVGCAIEICRLPATRRCDGCELLVHGAGGRAEA